VAEITPEPEVFPETVGITGVSASPEATEIAHRDEITLKLILVTLASLAEIGEISQSLEITLEEETAPILATETDLSLGEEKDTDPHLTTPQTKEITLGDLNPEIFPRATLTGVTPEINLGADPKNLLTDTPETGHLLAPEIALEAEISLRR